MLKFSQEKQKEMQAFVDDIMRESTPSSSFWQQPVDIVVASLVLVVLMGCSYTLGSISHPKEDLRAVFLVNEQKLIENWPTQQPVLEPFVLPDIEVIYVPTA